MLYRSFDSFWVYGDFVFGEGCIKNNLENNFIEFVLKIAFVRFILNFNAKIYISALLDILIQSVPPVLIQSVPPVLIQNVPPIPVKVYQCRLVLRTARTIQHAQFIEQNEINSSPIKNLTKDDKLS